MSSQLLDDLNECYAYLKRPNRWAQGEFIIERLTSKGRPYIAYCSLGIIDNTAVDSRRLNLIAALYDAIPKRWRGRMLAECRVRNGFAAPELKRDVIASYNDARSKRAVMNMWRKAIANEEARMMADVLRATANEEELVVAGD